MVVSMFNSTNNLKPDDLTQKKSLLTVERNHALKIRLIECQMPYVAPNYISLFAKSELNLMCTYKTLLIVHSMLHFYHSLSHLHPIQTTLTLN